MLKYLSKSDEETRKIAAKLAKTIKSNIFALTGQLGLGKTTFAQGFAKGLGIKEKIISPTFVLIKQYKIPNSFKIFFHVDLYRIDEKTDVNKLGFGEILSDPNTIILIEWAEKVESILPKKTTWINIKEDAGKRIVTIDEALS